MTETRRAFYLRMIAEQQQWIRSCGATLDGYVRNYGTADDPNRTGNGGEAVYKADTDALKRFERRLEQLGPNAPGEAAAPAAKATITYQQAAQTAIDCQDACNLSGVAKSLAGPVMDALWAEARRLQKGTDWINQHPIVTLMIDKLASLNRTDCSIQSFGKAMAEVEKIVAEPAVIA